jgi:hypothetical protein
MSQNKVFFLQKYWQLIPCSIVNLTGLTFWYMYVYVPIGLNVRSLYTCPLPLGNLGYVNSRSVFMHAFALLDWDHASIVPCICVMLEITTQCRPCLCLTDQALHAWSYSTIKSPAGGLGTVFWTKRIRFWAAIPFACKHFGYRRGRFIDFGCPRAKRHHIYYLKFKHDWCFSVLTISITHKRLDKKNITPSVPF